MSDSRTPQEREAARLERERRRGRQPSAPAEGRPSLEVDDWLDDGNGDGAAAAADDEHPDELASGTRRVGWHQRPPKPPRPPRTRRHLPSGGPDGPRPSRRHRLVAGTLALLALVLVAAVAWFAVEVFQPFHGSGHGSVTVTIPPHSGSREVGDLLAREGVVSSGFFFYLHAKLEGDSGTIYAGTYHLKLDMSYSQVLKVLTTPPPKIPVTNVTIIPGDTRVQVDARLRSEGVAGSYAAATRSSRLLRPTWYGAPARTPSLEGFLFPDTYQLRAPISVGALVADQLTEFRHVFSRVGLGYARSHGLSPYDVLIIASIVEKEAATVRDRPLVASVIYNRLKIGLPLGMDSTTRYEFNDYTKPLTNAQLATASPYNTRLNKGLPPTPIDSPGLASIQAASAPANSNDLYFVVKPCGNGSMTFTSSYSQFLADSAKYQQARNARGGQSPENCS
ncbi:MAG TPA: endolytic transglycosylase MltG [Solirubrobacteraceae bacterium]